jgi:DNA-binding IclR family transcriptional regulator
MTNDERQGFLSDPLPRYTPNSITDISTLLGRLDQIQSTGFSISYGEVNEELISISAPIFSADERLIAVLNLAAPASRMPQEAAEAAARLVVDAAERASRMMRFSQPTGEKGRFS